jgi:hypothetical protein
MLFSCTLLNWFCLCTSSHQPGLTLHCTAHTLVCAFRLRVADWVKTTSQRRREGADERKPSKEDRGPAPDYDDGPDKYAGGAPGLIMAARKHLWFCSSQL